MIRRAILAAAAATHLAAQSSMTYRRPGTSEYPTHYTRYLALVPEDDVVGALEQQQRATRDYLGQISESKAEHRYGAGKWTVGEVIGHILDTERLYGFRLLAFARGDRYPLAVADEDRWVQEAGFSAHPLCEFVDELHHVRASHVLMVRHLPPGAWDRTGTVSNYTISVRGLAYAMVGHERHHLNLLRERYRV
jgi:hypothetical protein